MRQNFFYLPGGAWRSAHRAPLPLRVTRCGRARAQVLHDAFFKHQTKPSLTPMGALYYEGREFEARVRARPGRPRAPPHDLCAAAAPALPRAGCAMLLSTRMPRVV